MKLLTVTKVGMTQLYNEAGNLVPVTLVKAGKREATLVEEGQKLTVTGVSKGKGFQGVMKRHGMAGSPRSHGHKDDLRRVGSIGSAFPERVFKGKRLPGHMGRSKVTIKNIEVVKVDPAHKLIAIKGALPGAIGSTVTLKLET